MLNYLPFQDQLRTFKRAFDWRFWLLLFSVVTGIYMFFLNPTLIETFGEQLIREYYVFSRTIFSPQTEYYAESVLVPLLAFLVGASHHYLFYKIFCSFLILLILPTIAYFAARYFANAWRSWVFILLFVCTYKYLWRTYYIGHPDPITIICFAAMVLQRVPIATFVFALLATVSHFSMALIGIGSFALLLLASPKDQHPARLTFVKYALAGLVIGRLLLELWFFRFQYHLQSRIGYAEAHGLTNFLARYDLDPLGFWLTPGLAFLIVYGLICAYMLYTRRIIFSIAMLIPLALAYISLFLTVDGLRVFVVVITAPYVFMLRTIVDELFDRQPKPLIA